MRNLKQYPYQLVIVVLAVFCLIGVVSAYSGRANTVVEGDAYIDSNGNVDEALGGDNYNRMIDFSEGISVNGTTVIDGNGAATMKEGGNRIETAAATTITAAQSGTTFYIDTADGFTYTLPAVSDGLTYRFVMASDPTATTTNYIIDSAEGDNIDGTLIVAGAVVDCRDEDQINFVNDDDLYAGDYVELRSDGEQWFLGDSGVLTSANMTCTDPS